MTRLTVALILLAMLGCTGTVQPEAGGDLDPPVVTTPDVETKAADQDETANASETKANLEVAKETDASTKPIVIDVRSPAEWKTGHVASAVNIPHTDIAKRIGEVTTDKSAEIVVYCKSGGRSGRAKKALEELGFTNVENAGGYEDVKERFAE